MKETMAQLEARCKAFKAAGLHINMERGWPCPEQLELSMPMLNLVTSETDLQREVDYRSYAGTGGILPLKRLFATLLGHEEDEIYIGGTMSTTLMYDIVSKAMLFGLGGEKPWKDCGRIRFLCPSPGYEKHFKICSAFRIEMIPVAIGCDGPDMDAVERLARDPAVKGIWCVPLYSNPTGGIYSEETADRLAAMSAAPDFRIFWDNAYFAHHLSERTHTTPNLLRKCAEQNHPDRVFEFASTSKITFPGGGVAVCASSRENIRWLTENSLLQLKTGDKINQLRHFLFLRSPEGLAELMRKHREIIGPKFDMADRVLHEELDGEDLAEWNHPEGGYFIALNVRRGMASEVWELCRSMGVTITPPGSTFPYGKDPDNSFLRLAPTFPDIKALELAIRVLAVSIKTVGERKGLRR